MDQDLLYKYFQDQCTEEELEQVMNWFHTEEGKDFLTKDMAEEFSASIDDQKKDAFSNVESEQIFKRIQLTKSQGHTKKFGVGTRIASILIVAVTISALLYVAGYISKDRKNPQPETITYVTAAGQQNIFTLSDGTQIRLNEKSRLTVPVKLQEGKRNVDLWGEAYFEVTRDAEHPFVVNTEESTVEVLGTKFNVKTDSSQNSVQVAVVEGKVALKQKGDNSSGGALLTRNNFGWLRLSDGQITIEKINAKNYLSWINNRLIYSGETLDHVSRQIEHLYDVEIAFSSNQLKKLELTANIERADLSEILDVIANTFEITYRQERGKIVWME